MKNTYIIKTIFNSFLIFLIVVTGCKEKIINLPENAVIGYHDFTNYSDFINTITEIGTLNEPALVDQLWDSLVENQQIPFIKNDSVAFLYRSSASEVNWAGDFNGWNPSWKGKKIDGTDIHIYETVFPSDARLDYKIVVGNSWKLDPANPHQQYGGFGPNSELRMPEWIYPMETLPKDDVIPGSLSDNQLIQSTNLNYSVNYKVYTPYNYTNQDNLPVIYVTDGHEYADDKLGSMVIVLNNLIYQQEIKPVIAVFIDPRDPRTGENRRGDEYRSNINFANFVSDELVNSIDQNYKTSSVASERAILGTSLGGWNAAYFGLKRSDVFQLIGIHSPASNDQLIKDHLNSINLPIKLFMSTGVIYDTEIQARALKEVFESKNYPLDYYELNQSHSWGNWRSMLKQPLIYFFGN